jgi:hypothetical protein
VHFLRSQWSRGLKHELSSLAGTLGSWVRIPLKAWISVCVYSVFVLSCIGSGLARGWSPVKGVCRLYRNDYETEEEARVQQRAVEPLMMIMIACSTHLKLVHRLLFHSVSCFHDTGNVGRMDNDVQKGPQIAVGPGPWHLPISVILPYETNQLWSVWCVKDWTSLYTAKSNTNSFKRLREPLPDFRLLSEVV